MLYSLFRKLPFSRWTLLKFVCGAFVLAALELGIVVMPRGNMTLGLVIVAQAIVANAVMMSLISGLRCAGDTPSTRQDAGITLLGSTMIAMAVIVVYHSNWDLSMVDFATKVVLTLLILTTIILAARLQRYAVRPFRQRAPGIRSGTLHADELGSGLHSEQFWWYHFCCFLFVFCWAFSAIFALLTVLLMLVDREFMRMMLNHQMRICIFFPSLQVSVPILLLWLDWNELREKYQVVSRSPAAPNSTTE